ncbi:hypothetical protein BdWA1_000158 [Babesia duncani]|uniref:Uncharacterized protein n=1 Tax=Babesia duncani TaxID=323732 RepID=A0AAD9PLQ7_9APIC|nr:hypothetical protein BdWA1_000158 [Babesia duncani]
MAAEITLYASATKYRFDVIISRHCEFNGAITYVHRVADSNNYFHNVGGKCCVVTMERKLNMKRVEVLHINNGIKLFKLNNPWYEEKYGDQRSKYIYHKIDNDRCGTISGGQFIYEWFTYTKISVEFDLSMESDCIKKKKYGHFKTSYSLEDEVFVASVSENNVLLWMFNQMNGKIFIEACMYGGGTSLLLITLLTLNEVTEQINFYKLNNLWYKIEDDGNSTLLSNCRNLLMVPPISNPESNRDLTTVINPSDSSSNISDQSPYCKISLDTSLRSNLIGYKIEDYSLDGEHYTVYITKKGCIFNDATIGDHRIRLDSMIAPFIIIITGYYGNHTMHIGSYENDDIVFVECLIPTGQHHCNYIQDKSLIFYSFPLNISEFPDERFYSSTVTKGRHTNYFLTFSSNAYFGFSFVVSIIEGDIVFIKQAPCSPFWQFSVDHTTICYRCLRGKDRKICLDKFNKEPQVETVQ